MNFGTNDTDWVVWAGVQSSSDKCGNVRWYVVFGVVAEITRWVGVGGGFFDGCGENGGAACWTNVEGSSVGGEGVAEPCEGC